MEAAAGRPTVYTQSPRGAQDVAVFHNRLFVLGGQDPVTLAGIIEHEAIYYTRALTAAEYTGGITDAVTKWQDEVSLATNKISIASQENDPGVALAQCGRNIAVLKRRSVLLLTGYGPDSFTIRTAVTGIGCIDPRSVVEVDDGCFFLSKDGYMFFDGVNIVNVSGGLRRKIVGAAMKTVVEGVMLGMNNCYAVRRPGGWVELMIAYTDLLFDEYIEFWGLYHIASGSWTEMVMEGSSSLGIRSSLYGTENYALADTGSDAWVVNQVTTPDSVAETFRGIDYLSSSLARYAMNAKWTSRVVSLASPLSYSKVRRVIVDYIYIVDGDASDGLHNHLAVTIADGRGATLGTGTLRSIADDGLVQVARGVIELDSETDTVQVTINRPGVFNPVEADHQVVKFEIRDVWIEYHEAQDTA
jgi:hypothetical protein